MPITAYFVVIGTQNICVVAIMKILTTKEHTILQRGDIKNPLKAYVYVTHEEVTGEKSTLGDVTSKLSQFNLHEVLHFIAYTNNTCLKKREKSNSQIQVSLVLHFFDLEARDLLSKSCWGGTGNNETIFHPHQQLFLLQQAVRSCTTKGEICITEQKQYEFGMISLMVNDLLAVNPEKKIKLDNSFGYQWDNSSIILKPIIHNKTKEEEKQEWLDILTIYIPCVEFAGNIDVLSETSHAWQLWIEVLSEISNSTLKDNVDFKQDFKNHHGVDIKEFLSTLWVAFSHYYLFDPEETDSANRLIIHGETHTNDTVYPKETFIKVLNNISCDIKDLCREIQWTPRQSEILDFTVLRKFPLIKVEENKFLCYDNTFLFRLLTHGMYWKILEALDKNKQEDFKTLFGSIFECFIARHFKQIYSSETRFSPVFICNPKFKSSNDEICDGLLDYGENLFIMEYKSALLTTRAKYSGNSELLKIDIRDKFVANRDKESKGVRQLARSIKRILRDGNNVIPNLEDRNYKSIYPIMVLYETSLVNYVAQSYLDLEFKEALGNESLSDNINIERLLIFSSRDVSAIEILVKRGLEFPELIKGYIAHMKTKPWDTFYTYTYNKYLKNTSPSQSNSLLSESFDAFTDQIMKSLIP